MTSKGFSNKYNKWNSITKDLVAEADEEEEKEKEEASQYLGLNGKIPRSKAEADERAKMEAVQLAKSALDKQKEIEEKKKFVIEDIVANQSDEVIVLDDERLEGRRVIVLRNCNGASFHLVRPKSITDSIIKVFIESCNSCSIKVEVPIITSMIEIAHCSDLKIKVSKYQVNTIQIDMSTQLHVEYLDPNSFGTGKDFKTNGDRIYHAGVSDMTFRIPISTKHETKTIERKIDYLADGAVQVAEQSAEEYQFATYVKWREKEATLVTERIHRVGSRIFTQSELNKQKKVNELDTMIRMDETDLKIKECETHKSEGNDEFVQGNYGQAVLLYSLAIEKSSNLDTSESSQKFEARHICFANRSACFLKLGHHEKALEDAASCIQLEPKYVKGFFRKGLALHAMARYSEALQVLSEAVKIEPKNKQIKQAIQFAEVKYEMEMRKRMSA